MFYFVLCFFRVGIGIILVLLIFFWFLMSLFKGVVSYGDGLELVFENLNLKIESVFKGLGVEFFVNKVIYVVVLLEKFSFFFF